MPKETRAPERHAERFIRRLNQRLRTRRQRLRIRHLNPRLRIRRSNPRLRIRCLNQHLRIRHLNHHLGHGNYISKTGVEASAANTGPWSFQIYISKILSLPCFTEADQAPVQLPLPTVTNSGGHRIQGLELLLSSLCLMEVDQIEADTLPSPTTTNSGNNQTGSHQKRRRLESPPPTNDVQADRRPLKRARGLVVQDGDHEAAPENRGSVARVSVSDGGIPVESWHQRWLRHALPWVRWFFFQLKRIRWFFPALRRVRIHIHFVGLGTPGRMIG